MQLLLRYFIVECSSRRRRLHEIHIFSSTFILQAQNPHEDTKNRKPILFAMEASNRICKLRRKNGNYLTPNRNKNSMNLTENNLLEYYAECVHSITHQT
jgi:hypothetical protein